MKTISLFSLLILSSLMFSTCETNPGKTNRVVIIALDGISVEGFNAAKLPNLDGLIAEGVLSLNTRVVMPSVTLTNWASHLTGSGPEQHGIADYTWKLDSFKLPPVEADNKGYYPSIFKVLKDQVPGIKTAFYYNWRKLITPYNQGYIDESSFEMGDRYLTNYEKALDFIVENKENPAFVFLYSVHTDHAGHKFGWMSPEYIAAIEEADVHIGEFLGKLKANGLYETTHFMFLSDHGGVGGIEGIGGVFKGHGGVSKVEMEVPWSITGPGIKKGAKLTEPNNTVNTAATIAFLFGCTPPLSWTGRVPFSIFE